MQTRKKPALREVPVTDVWPVRKGKAYITMSTGQKWDGLLDGAYFSGWVVLELDENEKPVKAYQRQDPKAN